MDQDPVGRGTFIIGLCPKIAMTEKQTARLKLLFSDQNDVAFAYLFGSAVSGRQTSESDVDIAVYFLPNDRDTPLDMEEPNAHFDSEYELWSKSDEICNRNVDFVVLNRAPATVAAAALLTGSELAANAPGIYRAFFNAVTSLAEEYREFAEDFIKISRRSKSLTPIDKDRLIRILQYVRMELEDAPMYVKPDLKRFSTDGHYRRGTERWVENLVNASIDIAKIILASEGANVPQTYRDQMMTLGHVTEFESVSEMLAKNTRIRNALAHEYLDLRFAEVKSVVASAGTLYGEFADLVDKWIDNGGG